MSNTARLGQFEEYVLRAVQLLGENAYGVSIRQTVCDATNRDVALSGIYAALDRLSDKGFAETWLGEPTPQRGGRAKRYYRITGLGEQLLREIARSRTRLTPILEA